MIIRDLLDALTETLEQRGWGLVVRGNVTDDSVSVPVLLHTPGGSLEVQVHAPVTRGLIRPPSNHESVISCGMVLAPSFRPAQAEALRRANINFADAQGNMFLNAPGFYIDIRGQRSDSRAWKSFAEENLRINTPLDLFTPARSRVVFALVTWPELFQGNIREISRVSGVSLGATQRVVEAIREQYDGFDRHARAELYSDWLAAYPRRLLPKITIAEFQADDPRKVIGRDIWLSGESALPSRIRPATTTVYVTEVSPHLMNSNRWRKSSTPNVSVRRKFWEDPIDWRATLDGPAFAPSTLIYADLMADGDARVREVAREFAWDDIQLRELITR
ncbi:type IV toxin-antitoxin system AbiEi family antitoxin [Paenarthrobacter sp. NPDC057355]|uniref:type IV toxin-antitoxin system AbiEi family antitoxin n=1 Tax=Paenarthrobacter sp. NPDC057355 TaxID=3346105 RepID=UPI0036395E5E